MDQRIRIGIVFENNENWIGGSYYILNLIESLKTLPDDKQPLITVFTKTEEEAALILQTNYHYLEKRKLRLRPMRLSLFKRVLNKLADSILGYDSFAQPFALDTGNVEAIFPASPGMLTEGHQKKVYWIPDFQEIYYPQFFSKEQIKGRMQNYRFIAKTRDTVVFSSTQALQDFVRLFPSHRCKTSVMQFAVTHPRSEMFDSAALQKKYDLTGDFYIAPNQFWVHKNQEIIINAAYILKKRNKLSFKIAFTGKEHDPRNPGYPESLKILVRDLGLQENIKFLGFISREDQLNLIRTSVALIQPSLFEGWSTVIEDGKALNKFIIASDLPVHREQLHENAEFFNPKDAEELAGLLVKFKPKKIKEIRYAENIKKFAADFLAIVKGC